MQAQLNRLETLLSRTVLTEKDPPVVIQHVHIDHPKLDQLTFHLDEIDIDQLSGQLNIGTNSGIRPASVSASDKTRTAAIPKESDDGKKKSAEDVFTQTSTGYRHKPKS